MSEFQIAYLENLLKLYNDEIYRLQQVELSLDDMETEDSTYIQEHKLKRKVCRHFNRFTHRFCFAKIRFFVWSVILLIKSNHNLASV